MAINLLAMANKLGSGLGGGSSPSRTRTSYQNQPGNLRRGTHIPGTNLKEDQGIKSTARKGRKGDNKLRRVGGEVAHVNTTEANAIDALGPMGEAWVQSIGSGTRNPRTGLPEYHLWHKHGAHTKIGKGIESFGRGVTTGNWKSTAAVNAEKKNAQQYGRQYAESGGKQFYTDRLNQLLNSNIAGVQSSVLEEGGPFGDLSPGEGNVPKYGDFGHMMGQHFKLNPNSTDFKTFAPPYKKAEEDKLVGDLGRLDQEYGIEFGGGGTESGMSSEGIKTKGIAQTLKDTLSSVGSAIKTTASDLSSGLFGLLTQTQEKQSTGGFAGAGDFGTEFAQNQMLKDADVSFEDANTKRESAQTTAELDTAELANIKEKADISLDFDKANIIQQIQGLHDDYNKNFHINANAWVGNKFS